MSYHRNGTAGKSQWTISVDDELMKAVRALDWLSTRYARRSISYRRTLTGAIG